MPRIGNIGRGRALLGGANRYDPAAQAIFNAFTTPPTEARKALINACVVALKNAGVWTTLDALYMMAAADSQAARINWVSPATFTLSPINSPTFTADRGFTGDGVSSYINTGINLGPAATKAQQNSHAFCVFMQAGADANVTEYGGSDISFASRNLSGNVAIRSAFTTADGVAVTNGLGNFLVSRSISSGYDRYQNGLSFGTGILASSPFASQNLFLLCRNNGSGTPTLFSARTIAAHHIGSSLNSTQAANAASAILTYMQAVGAA